MKEKTVSYLYKKRYVKTPTGTLRLNNVEPAKSYITARIKELESIFGRGDKEAEKKCKIKILHEFKEIYDYDLTHDSRPIPSGNFHSKDSREKFIRISTLADDISFYLGNICLNCHEYIIKNIKDAIPVVDYDPFVIDYNELYLRVANEYFATLLGFDCFPNFITSKTKDWEEYTRLHQGKQQEYYAHAPGTTFILPSLIEHSLTMYLSNRLMFTGLDRIDEKINSSMLVSSLTKDEEDIYSIFMSYRKTGKGNFSVPKDQTLEALYNLFIRQGVMQDSKDSKNRWDMKDLLMEKKGGIGGLLHSDYCKSQIVPEYYNLLQYIFATDKLNIRNSIMHGNDNTYDYLAIGIAAILMQLYWDIMNRDIFIQYKI